jgi:drug/metabolite transporter (DMT)-like permease
MISGVAWGLYTIFGKRSSNATLNTTDNFTKSLIFVLIFFAFFVKNINISTYGISLAFISGGITSSIGYLLWYHLLPNMKIITSGVLQLLIPPLAIFLGVIFLNEEVTSTLIISTILILFGILISIYKKTK